MRKTGTIIVCLIIVSMGFTPFVNQNVRAAYTITIVAQNYITSSSTVEWNFNNEGWNSFVASGASSEPYSPGITGEVYKTTSDGSFISDGTLRTLKFRFTNPTTGQWVQLYDGHHSGSSGWYNYREITSKWDWNGDYVIYVSIPYEPYNPQPSDGATNQPLGITLSWTSDQTNPSYPAAIEPEPNGAVTMDLYYDIFFGDANPPPYVTYESYKSGGNDYNTYTPPTLLPETTYFWQIIAYNENDGGGKTGRSSPVWSFTTGVEPGPLDYFEFDTISSPQTAGNSFSITITAKDSTGNTVNDFTGTVTLSDSTSTINPTSSGSFTNGVWTGPVIIYTPQTEVNISASGDGKTGTSNLFDVVSGTEPGPLDHFEFDAIPNPQTAGNPFSVTISAKDSNGNTVTDFTGTVALSDTTGTISPTITDSFSNGVWTGSVTISSAQTGVSITASGEGKTGNSNSFDVV